MKNSASSINFDLIPTPQVRDISLVLQRLLDDGGYQTRAAERKDIIAAIEADRKIRSAIAETAPDAVRAEHSRQVRAAEKPLESTLEARMESAQLHRRELKRRLSVSSIAVASVVKGCLERALVAADTVIAILEENERDKANSFGVEFSPSATIGACIAARRILVGQLEQVTRNPELISPESVARLLGINIAA